MTTTTTAAWPGMARPIEAARLTPSELCELIEHPSNYEEEGLSNRRIGGYGFVEAVSGGDVFHAWAEEWEWDMTDEVTAPRAIRPEHAGINVWQSPEFATEEDAASFLQFAWIRWRVRGSFGCAGMVWRDDLDHNHNPIF